MNKKKRKESKASVEDLLKFDIKGITTISQDNSADSKEISADFNIQRVVIEGKKTNGEIFRKPFENDMKIVNLQGKQLSLISLSSLAEFTNLQKLRLAGNQLSSISLSPLSKCPNFESLYLGGNQLTSIDLSPLAECSNLQELRLNSNQLSSIDLSPLTHCKNLRFLYLQKNKFVELDLSPLSNHSNLERFFLHENPLISINLNPLVQCLNLQEIMLDNSTTILWEDAILNTSKLSIGLQKYQAQIQKAHKQYLSKKEER